MRNLIYNGIHTPVSVKLLNELARHFTGSGSVLTIYSDASKDASVSLPPGVSKEGLDYHACARGEYPHIDGVALDADLLEKFSPYLMDALKMMDRLRGSDVVLFEQRIELLFKHLRFWNAWLETRKVDLFLAINVPHEIHDFILYALCKIKGVRVLFFMHTQLYGYVQLLESIQENDPRLLEVGRKISSELAVIENPLVSAHWEAKTAEYAAPFYMKGNFEKLKIENGIRFRIMHRIRQIADLVNRFSFKMFEPGRLGRYLVVRSLNGRKSERLLEASYQEQCTREPNLNIPYIFVPLHFQPEATTSPQGGWFVYQELMVELLASSLPADVTIYVKEHPMQKIKGRELGFYERIKAMRNVYFVPKSMESKKLIQGALAVGTVTGTAAWEALFEGKQALLFGHVFFKHAPGVHVIKNAGDIRNAWNAVCQKGREEVIKEFRGFLAGIDKLLVRGWIDPAYEKVSDIDDDTNVQNLVNAVQSALDLQET